MYKRMRPYQKIAQDDLSLGDSSLAMRAANGKALATLWTEKIIPPTPSGVFGPAHPGYMERLFI